MEFITVEQFQEQPKEIQQVFLDWWQPSVGDIFMDLAPNSKKKLLVIEDEGDCVDIELIKSEVIPLFTEGQLRKFIEDKTGGKVESYYAWDYYTIAIRDTGCGGDDTQYDTGKANLLQAYWKVACMIANDICKL